MGSLPSFSGGVAVIGAAGGIGMACARRFAQAGARLILFDRDVEALNGLAAELGAPAHGIDITDENSVREAAETAEATLGRVRGMINCAAVFQAPVPPERLSMSRWNLVVDVTLKGAYLSCVAFGLKMRAAGGGAIVNIASVAGIRSFPLHAYSPAKAGVISLTEGLAAEWGRSGVRVNAISPGFTETPGVLADIAREEGGLAPLVEGTAMGRLVKPIEVANAAVFLMSDEASGITGINLPVDCGWLAAEGWQPYGGVNGRNPATDKQIGQ